MFFLKESASNLVSQVLHKDDLMEEVILVPSTGLELFKGVEGADCLARVDALFKCFC